MRRLLILHDADEENILFDRVEWITDKARAREVGVYDSTFDAAGFYVYNEEVLMETLPVSADCKVTILDWEGNYVPEEVSISRLKSVLQEREEKYNATELIPYQITVRGGTVTVIEEHYVP